MHKLSTTAGVAGSQMEGWLEREVYTYLSWLDSGSDILVVFLNITDVTTSKGYVTPCGLKIR